ncbi:Zinc finger, AN1-type [Dillenia turbinata]|uniref:Zinc finger, AN1-type n=1 Tax=Dillenia turbinata TaxID=194707 RepID=A0AAN8UA32_9MAGN
MGGGTEAFPDLGKHCQYPECNQLDFLPFTCVGCLRVFCLDHRSYKSHLCSRSDHDSRKVIVCDICSTSIETTGHNKDDEKAILEKHEKSGDCDPRKKKRPTCPVKRCRQVLTFSNTSVCKTCNLKTCLKHRFAADHACSERLLSMSTSVSVAATKRLNEKLLENLALRNGKDCRTKDRRSSSSPPPTPTSVKAF